MLSRTTTARILRSAHKEKSAGLKLLKKQHRMLLKKLLGESKDVPLYHQTRGLPEIAETGTVRASAKARTGPDVHAAHGEGVYWDRGVPATDRWVSPSAEGVITTEARARPRRGGTENIGGISMGSGNALTAPYSLSGRDILVADLKRYRKAALEASPDNFTTLAGLAADKKLVPNPDFPTEALWMKARGRVHTSPEARQIQRRGLPAMERGIAIRELVEDEIGRKPRRGLQLVDSQVMHLARKHAKQIQAARRGEGRAPTHQEMVGKLADVYKAGLKQRRKLRKAGRDEGL